MFLALSQFSELVILFNPLFLFLFFWLVTAWERGKWQILYINRRHFCQPWISRKWIQNRAFIVCVYIYIYIYCWENINLVFRPTIWTVNFEIRFGTTYWCCRDFKNISNTMNLLFAIVKKHNWDSMITFLPNIQWIPIKYIHTQRMNAQFWILFLNIQVWQKCLLFI